MHPVRIAQGMIESDVKELAQRVECHGGGRAARRTIRDTKRTERSIRLKTVPADLQIISKGDGLRLRVEGKTVCSGAGASSARCECAEEAVKDQEGGRVRVGWGRIIEIRVEDFAIGMGRAASEETGEIDCAGRGGNWPLLSVERNMG